MELTTPLQDWRTLLQPSLLSIPSTTWGQSTQDFLLEAGTVSLSHTGHAGVLVLDFTASRTERTEFLLFVSEAADKDGGDLGHLCQGYMGKNPGSGQLAVTLGNISKASFKNPVSRNWNIKDWESKSLVRNFSMSTYWAWHIRGNKRLFPVLLWVFEKLFYFWEAASEHYFQSIGKDICICGYSKANKDITEDKRENSSTFLIWKQNQHNKTQMPIWMPLYK